MNQIEFNLSLKNERVDACCTSSGKQLKHETTLTKQSGVARNVVSGYMLFTLQTLTMMSLQCIQLT